MSFKFPIGVATTKSKRILYEVLYRTSGVVTEQIVLERRSRPRVRLVPAVAFTLVFGGTAAMVVVGARDHWVAAHVSIVAFALVAAGAMFVRTQKLTVVRAGRELLIREGRISESVLVGEVLDVDIDTRGKSAYAVVFVLRDGRRVLVGEPREWMEHAASDRRTIREALLR
jgi:hypothetical protein